MIGYKKVNNSDKFRQAAINFQRMGFYTAAPRGTTAYKEYWNEERRRCIEGYTAEDGDFITGYNYFYVNYCQIIIVKEKEVTLRSGQKKTIKARERGFPKFYDWDYYFFNAVEEAETQGKHLVVLKARGKGYSFKCASMLCRNFYLIPESNSYAIAAEAEFLLKDGILTKAWDFMDFVDANTAWYKKRQKTDTKIHKRASIVIDIDGVKTEVGYKSEIMGITLKNDPQKARGKRGKLILWEEAGKFPGLKQAWQIAQPSVEEDGVAFGLMIAFGTGGTEEGDYEGLKDLFYEPDAYNALPLENSWDEGATKPCGFFVPEYVNMTVEDEGKPLMDKDGNSELLLARAFATKKRQIVVENASDKRAVDRYIAERPFTPMEATLQLYGNIFPKTELARHLAYIRTHKDIANYKQVGDLIFSADGELNWVPASSPKDITKYKLTRDDDPSGQIVIWEHPVPDPPYGLYIAGCDPYDHDKAGTDSLGSTFVYKRFQDFESYFDVIVAEYTGRPDTAEEYYENVRKLMIYYRATVLFENERKGIYPYFQSKSQDYLLADQPDYISEIIKDSKVQRRKGVHMVQGIKDWAEIQIRDWLNEEHEPGKKNITRILSEPLLEELISYNDEGNFDRVIALMMIMIYKAQLHHLHVKKKEGIEKNRRLILDDGLFRDYKKLPQSWL